ncbi:DNA-processing protein DprA [Lampropedia cohaerens]|nr:DNA-processing protein DprA [Lampropedia cohaerens]
MQLLHALGSPEQIFSAPASTLAQVLGSSTLAAAVQAIPAGWDVYCAQVQRWLTATPADAGAPMRAVFSLVDPRYPAPLRELPDPPLLLYAVGAPRWLQPVHEQPWWQMPRAMLAVVGSRQPTAQGAVTARAFSAAIAAQGVCVVSGLARGIDAAAHLGALEADNASLHWPATVAVMGTGADRVYPSCHRDLAHRIARHGLLLTEQPLGAAPLATHFPKRNRIITGLCRATLVVEATEKSGSLVSARLAAEQGRDVLAVPGSILSPQSRGCHWLIKQGARLADTPEDVLDELGLAPAMPQPAGTAAAPVREDASPKDSAMRRQSYVANPLAVPPHASAQAAERQGADRHQALLQAMGFDPVPIEVLSARTGLATAVLQAQLLELELLGAVARLPGGSFQRIAAA